MYYDINRDAYTTSIPSGSRGYDWVQVYSKTKKALTLEDLKQFPNIYKSFQNSSSKFYYKIYTVASRLMDDYGNVFSKNFEKDIENPIFGVHLKNYDEYLEFLELTPNTRWDPDSFSRSFDAKILGYDRTLVWDYFNNKNDALDYFLDNVYTLEEYKNQFLNKTNTEHGKTVKVQRHSISVIRGEQITGNIFQSKKGKTSVRSGYFSN